MSVLTACTGRSGARYEAVTGKGDPYEGQDDVWVTRDGEKVWGTNSLGDDSAYTNAKRRAWQLAEQDEQCKQLT